MPTDRSTAATTLATTLAVLAWLLPAGALAQPADDGGDGSTRPLWEAGLVGLAVSQAAYPGSAERVDRVLPLPWAVYRGRVLRAEQGNLGLRAARTDQAELDIGFAGSFGSSGSGGGVRRGLPAIGTLVEFGPRLRWRLGEVAGGRLGVTAPLRGVFDLSHDFRYRGLAFEPALGWGTRVGSFNLGLSVGALVGDRRLNDSFYGVAPAYATAWRPAHEAKAGLIATRLSANLSRRLGPDWLVFAFVRSDLLDGAANVGSPLVERRRSTSGGIGLTWTFARSALPAEP